MTDRVTLEEAVEMLRKARIENADVFDQTVANFMRLAYRTGQADENEACAKVAEEDLAEHPKMFTEEARKEATFIARRIRKRMGA